MAAHIVTSSACLLPPLLQVLLGGLGDQVHIAVRVCDAIGRLAEGFTAYAGRCPGHASVQQLQAQHRAVGPSSARDVCLKLP